MPCYKLSLPLVATCACPNWNQRGVTFCLDCRALHSRPCESTLKQKGTESFCAHWSQWARETRGKLFTTMFPHLGLDTKVVNALLLRPHANAERCLWKAFCVLSAPIDFNWYWLLFVPCMELIQKPRTATWKAEALMWLSPYRQPQSN